MTAGERPPGPAIDDLLFVFSIIVIGLAVAARGTRTRVRDRMLLNAMVALENLNEDLRDRVVELETRAGPRRVVVDGEGEATVEPGPGQA